jgi:hypothetical protein
MTASSRRGALGLLVAAAMLAVGVAGARAAGVTDARISTTYVMHGQIVAAVRVRGEHRGQSITRRWTFRGVDCAGSVCRRLTLRRRRARHRVDRLALIRVGVGTYVGRGRFSAALRCAGRRYAHGLVVPYTITVQVTQAVSVEGIAFASRLGAVYANRRRFDHTPCPLGPSHDAAWYLGAAAPVPSPPAARFTVTSRAGSQRATFTDTSRRGAGGARIVSRVWQFGDLPSGIRNTSAGNPAGHMFSSSGTYKVALTVTDANGLAASATRTMTVPRRRPAVRLSARSGSSPGPRSARRRAARAAGARAR